MADCGANGRICRRGRAGEAEPLAFRRGLSAGAAGSGSFSGSLLFQQASEDVADRLVLRSRSGLGRKHRVPAGAREVHANAVARLEPSDDITVRRAARSNSRRHVHPAELSPLLRPRSIRRYEPQAFTDRGKSQRSAHSEHCRGDGGDHEDRQKNPDFRTFIAKCSTICRKLHSGSRRLLRTCLEVASVAIASIWPSWTPTDRACRCTQVG